MEANEGRLISAAMLVLDPISLGHGYALPDTKLGPLDSPDDSSPSSPTRSSYPTLDPIRTTSGPTIVRNAIEFKGDPQPEPEPVSKTVEDLNQKLFYLARQRACAEAKVYLAHPRNGPLTPGYGCGAEAWDGRHDMLSLRNAVHVAIAIFGTCRTVAL
ncbi:hypothetical protein C8J56DRAFT_898645 [Mycena floridula]|nr:hypothetical protein C8J56DRAFT_898645 [Mycena floridula]